MRRVGRYLMQDRIASGGMAAVHIGQIVGPAGFIRRVAIKRMHDHLSEDPEFSSMFLDEARLAACVQHPNVVATLDIVRDQGELLLVMDYVLGESLSSLLATARKTGKPIPLRIASSIASGVLNGLHAAHEARDDRGEPMNIVHRDVSPANVLVGADGVARVIDFGIAKAVARLHSTQDGKIKGKLAYMAPEQLKREAVDRRADVYAAGVVLWEMMTSKRLFASDDLAAIASAILRGADTLLSEHREDVPLAVESVVRKAIAVDPGERYATALDFVEALEAAAPPAPSREVAVWIASVAGHTLDERRKLAQDVPTASDAIAIVDRPPVPSAAATPSLRKARIYAIAIAGAALVLGTLAFPLRGALRGLTRPAAAGVPVAEGGSRRPPPLAPLPDVAGRGASPQPAVSAVDLGALVPDAVVAPPEVLHTSVKPARAKHPATSCTPPFTLGENGVKHFKPECF